jgi:small subunit ribosomal protein S4
MGDPKKTRKKFTTPSHPWIRARLEVEKEVKLSYGLKNKKEIYKMDSFLRRIKSQMKKLSSETSAQAEKERQQLLTKLKKLHLIGEEGSMDTVLGLELKNVLERRLQSIVFKKGLASSMKQARQFIIHQHICIGDKKITSPSYLVSAGEESMITFAPVSNLSNIDHPERMAARKDIKKELDKTKIKKSGPVDEDLDMPEIPQPTKEVVISDEEAAELEAAASKE